jgi:hypothetical protein
MNNYTFRPLKATGQYDADCPIIETVRTAHDNPQLSDLFRGYISLIC